MISWVTYALRASPSSLAFGRYSWKFIWTLRSRTAPSGLGTRPESTRHHLRTRCYAREESDSTASEPYGSVGHLSPARFSCGSLCNIEYGHPIEGCCMGYRITPHHVIFVARRRITLLIQCVYSRQVWHNILSSTRTTPALAPIVSDTLES